MDNYLWAIGVNRIFLLINIKRIVRCIELRKIKSKKLPEKKGMLFLLLKSAFFNIKECIDSGYGNIFNWELKSPGLIFAEIEFIIPVYLTGP